MVERALQEGRMNVLVDAGLAAAAKETIVHVEVTPDFCDAHCRRQFEPAHAA